jgi:hypothetical protein
MERINRRGRSEPLAEGDRVVVWVPGTAANADGAGVQAGSASLFQPSMTPPLGAAPAPELLPPLP